MQRMLTATLASFMCFGGAYAQTSTDVSASQTTSLPGNQTTMSSTTRTAEGANVSPAAPSSQWQSGSTVHAALTKPVDVRKDKPGDQVVVKTTQDVRSNGQIVLPRGSKIVGHVTEAKAHVKGQQDSSLGLAFDHAVLKNGTTVPVSFAVQAIGNRSNATPVEDDSLMSSSTGMAPHTASSSVRQTGGGLIGGAGSAAGSVSNTAVGTTGSFSGLSGSVSAPLSAASQGVVGMPNFNLAAAATSSTSSMITSKTTNVRLDSGTEMILRANQ